MTSVLYIKGVCRKCIFISDVKTTTLKTLKLDTGISTFWRIYTCNVVFDIIKRGTEEAHITCDWDTTFKVNRFKVNLQRWGHITSASVTACYICMKMRCHDGITVHFRQLQSALYSLMMSVGLNSVSSQSEMCQAGQVINICKSVDM